MPLLIDSEPQGASAVSRAGFGVVGTGSFVARLLSRPSVYGSLVPLVTLLNAGVGLLLPMLMTPGQFGRYSLAVTLFQYGLIFDLGASQLIDRLVPAHLGANRPADAEATAQRLLWLRLYIAIVAYAVTTAILVAMAARHDLPFSLGEGLVSALAGILYMVALGPVCVYRARSDRRDYAVLIMALSSGLVIARPAGLVAGGVLGSFAALVIWYFVSAILVHRRMPPRLAERPSLAEAASFVARGVPLFCTSFVWAFYITANRWFAARLIPPETFGPFAFGANILALLVGAAAGFSAFYYPKMTARLAAAPAFGLSRTLATDCLKLVLGTAAVMAVGILLARPLIALVYPSYVTGAAAARIMLVAVPPLALASWFMPISLSAGRHPWVDGLVVYPVATVLLGAASWALFRVLGEQGVAWASTASAILLIFMQVALLRHARILTSRDAAVLASAASLVSAGLASLIWMVG
jgi:O-antigen/teichoic acid export membrane protein